MTFAPVVETMDDAAPLLGIDHERLTYFYQGRRFRLTDVHGKVVEDLIA